MRNHVRDSRLNIQYSKTGEVKNSIDWDQFKFNIKRIANLHYGDEMRDVMDDYINSVRDTGDTWYD